MTDVLGLADGCGVEEVSTDSTADSIASSMIDEAAGDDDEAGAALEVDTAADSVEDRVDEGDGDAKSDGDETAEDPDITESVGASDDWPTIDAMIPSSVDDDGKNSSGSSKETSVADVSKPEVSQRHSTSLTIVADYDVEQLSALRLSTSTVLFDNKSSSMGVSQGRRDLGKGDD